MEISNKFIEQYMTCGQTYDNFIFENCPSELLDMAQESLSRSNNGVLPVCVALNKDDEEKILHTLSNFDQIFQKQILMRDFVTSVIMKEILSNYLDKDDQKLIRLDNQIDAFYNNDYEAIKDNHQYSYIPSDIANAMRKYGKIELNLFLKETKSILLQQAFNNLIASREPYSIKLFTTNESLPTYYDQMGNLIESPHDYMSRNAKDFIIDDMTM